MSEMVRIRSVKQYFNDFIAENQNDLPDAMKRARIKMQLLDAFRREIFEQIVFRYGADVLKRSRDEMANMTEIQNILVQSFRKWRRLCMLCNDAGLVNWICLEDLRKVLDEEDAPDGTVVNEHAENSAEAV